VGDDIAKTSESMLRLSHNKSGQVLVGGEPPAELMGPACEQRRHGLDDKPESCPVSQDIEETMHGLFSSSVFAS
jgi:hypothetical protein